MIDNAKNTAILKPKLTKGCACIVHLRNEPDKPCIGHGFDCLCTKLLKKPKEKK